VLYYKPKPRSDGPIIDKLSDLAERHPTLGFWKMYDMIRMEQILWNHKRVHRVYVEIGLNIRRKKKRRLPVPVKEPLTWPIDANIVWSMDFMQDSLTDGTKFRTLNVIDDFNREALNIVIDTSISSKRMTRELDKIIQWRGKPKKIRVDNGPEFTSFHFVQWAKEKEIQIQYIQPGKPVQNSFIERFNRSYRQEILSAFLFERIPQVRELTEEWISIYNHQRPHDSLNGLTPERFLLKYGKLSEFTTFQQDVNINENFIHLNVAN
jgi:putative transposase